MLLLDHATPARPESAAIRREALERLDATQAAALACRDRLIRVLGAPGTGKTALVLAAALDRMTPAGPRPGRCLVVTGDRMRAGELRARLTHALGRATSHPPGKAKGKDHLPRLKLL